MSIHLNRKLVLEAADRVADGAGGFTEVWTAQGTLWASVKTGSGRERFGEAVTVSSVQYRIIVRAAPEGAPSRPRPDQRFREGDRLFRIQAVAEYDQDSRYLTCFAREELVG
ncbi:MAG: phage head closure protein [Pseudomonadota bacterium]